MLNNNVSDAESLELILNYGRVLRKLKRQLATLTRQRRAKIKQQVKAKLKHRTLAELLASFVQWSEMLGSARRKQQMQAKLERRMQAKIERRLLAKQRASFVQWSEMLRFAKRKRQVQAEWRKQHMQLAFDRRHAVIQWQRLECAEKLLAQALTHRWEQEDLIAQQGQEIVHKKI